MSPADTSLIPISEAALLARIHEEGKEYIRQARAPRTQDAYDRAWEMFSGWCARRGVKALPAEPSTVGAWMISLACGAEDGRPRARRTINQYLSAVVY